MIYYNEEADSEMLDSKSSKEIFYEYMKKNNLDFYDIDEVTKLPRFINELGKNVDLFNHFNNVLYKLNRENKINIVESMAYITSDYLEPKVAIKMLDELNYYSLMNELKTRYKIDKQDNGLNEFFL